MDDSDFLTAWLTFNNAVEGIRIDYKPGDTHGSKRTVSGRHAALFGQRHDLVFLAGHFSASSGMRMPPTITPSSSRVRGCAT